MTKAHLRAAHVVPARWSFAELEDWHSSLLQVAVDLDSFGINAVMSAVDVMNNQIIFVTVDSARFRAVEQALARQGLPCGLVRLVLP